MPKNNNKNDRENLKVIDVHSIWGDNKILGVLPLKAKNKQMKLMVMNKVD